MLDAAYLALALCASPLLVWRRLVQGKDRRGNAEKWLGRGEARTGNEPCLWLHAVSVGEVLQLRPVLEELERTRPDLELVLSTTTVTGHDVALEKYPRCRVVFFPLDFSWACVPRSTGFVPLPWRWWSWNFGRTFSPKRGAAECRWEW